MFSSTPETTNFKLPLKGKYLTSEKSVFIKHTECWLSVYIFEKIVVQIMQSIQFTNIIS